MKLLLDTHAFLWWLEGNRQLSTNARSAISDDANDVVVSAATAWEIATSIVWASCRKPNGWRRTCWSACHRQWHQANIRHYRLTLRLAYVQWAAAGPNRNPFDRLRCEPPVVMRWWPSADGQAAVCPFGR